LLNQGILNLPAKLDRATWLNYARCHDDIGLGFDNSDIIAVGYEPYAHRRFLVDYYTGVFDDSPARGQPFARNEKTGDVRISGSLASLAGLETALERGDPDQIQSSIDQILLLHGLIMSFGGIPLLYYGDEIGMGDNIFLGDRNGVRTPMQWSPDRNAGFSRANPQQLYLPIIVDPELHFEVINVEARENNHHSLLWWMRRLISLRKRFKAFSRGTLTFLHPENQTIVAFVRSYEDQNLLVVANLSRFVQFVELDLSAFAKVTPVEMFGLTEFPTIDKSPYPLTIGPHSFYWFYLQPASVRTEDDQAVLETAGEPPLFECVASWQEVLADRTRSRLEKVLSAYVRSKRWFGGKARQIKQARIQNGKFVHVTQGDDGRGSTSIVIIRAAVEIGHHIALGQGLITQLIALTQRSHRLIPHIIPLAVDNDVQFHDQRHTVVQGVQGFVAETVMNLGIELVNLIDQHRPGTAHHEFRFLGRRRTRARQYADDQRHQ